MNWKTKEQIAAAAQEGKLPALRMSLEHHQQGRDATRRELIDAIEDGLFRLNVDFCACCKNAGHTQMAMGYLACQKCPLNEPGEDLTCCGDLYLKVNASLNLLKKDYSNANFDAFQAAESAICDYISKVIESEEAKEKKPTKKPPRHLDWGYDNWGNFRLVLAEKMCGEACRQVGFGCLDHCENSLLDIDIRGNILDLIKDSKKC